MTASHTNSEKIPEYKASEIEAKWQSRWASDNIYHANDNDTRERHYFLTMFPYTSGDLHIGHWYAIAPSDTAARYQRMCGKNVLFPIGFDAFGLPAENAAIREGIHPMTWTFDNIDRMRTQLKTMGSSFDWEREIITAAPDYYKWTQWWFLQLLKHNLAYRGIAPANWCPGCQTVLANEQVIRDSEGLGHCERCESVVELRDLEQWFLRITEYAEELLDFSGIEWPEQIVAMQRNWIGQSKGMEVRFPLAQPTKTLDSLSVFTTRPDTLFGVTFMILAPEHPDVDALTTTEQQVEVENYRHKARLATEIERQTRDRPKTGVFTGSYVFHPLTKTKIPIWIADYVLLGYGTGAIMGVPAHDTRDFDFAVKHEMDIPVVIAPPKWDREPLKNAFTGNGQLINSGEFDGLSVPDAIQAISFTLTEQSFGIPKTSYKIRDWLVSRQRYWGAPIPIVHCTKCGTVPAPEEELPILLPEDAEFLPTGESPLALNNDFLNTTCPKCDGIGRRETDTMDTFMCSSWYMFRYADPQNIELPIGPELAEKWLPVDQYTGGAEHAVMHLLYARFFTKAARDMGILPIDEPFHKLFNQGTITKDGHKMSKSRGNVVSPDEWVAKVGADAVRLYLMFLGPWDQGGDWDDSGIQGHARWLNRVWALVLSSVNKTENIEANVTIRRLTHQMIMKVTTDLTAFRFNTMLAHMMEFTNDLSRIRERGKIDSEAWKEAIKSLVLCLAPSAPHISEELWGRMGNTYSIHLQPWPDWDPTLIQTQKVTIVVQVNGKVRGQFDLAPNNPKDETISSARQLERVQKHLTGKTIQNVIYVPDKLVNFVVV